MGFLEVEACRVGGWALAMAPLLGCGQVGRVGHRGCCRCPWCLQDRFVFNGILLLWSPRNERQQLSGNDKHPFHAHGPANGLWFDHPGQVQLDLGIGSAQGLCTGAQPARASVPRWPFTVGHRRMRLTQSLNPLKPLLGPHP